MASTTGKSGNSSSARTNSTRKNSTGANSGSSASSSSSRGKTRSSSQSRSKAKSKNRISVFNLFKSSAIGRFLLILAMIVCILGVDFLFSLNHFDVFFLILGIELLLAVLIGWIRFVLRGRIDDEDN